MCIYLFAPSRGQPLCFSLWINNSGTLGKIKTFKHNPSIQPHKLNEKMALFGLWTRAHVILAKPSRAKIQPNWILQFVTLIESTGSVVFTWGPFEVELAARPITILSHASQKPENTNILAPEWAFYVFIFLRYHVCIRIPKNTHN